MWKLKFNLRSSDPPDPHAASVFFERLEPKILFSADALSGLVSADPFSDGDTANAGMNISESASFLKEAYAPGASNTDDQLTASVTESLQLDTLQAALDGDSSANAAVYSLDTLEALLDGAETGMESRQEIIFVDAATPDYQQLLGAVNTDTPGTDYQIFILQSDRDGIEQITEILGGFDAVDAIHLVSHGNETGLQLGNSWLGQTSLDDYANAISSWSGALAEDADLLIYGCNLAANASGQQLIDNLAKLTTADVAASDDLTGAATLGGDWQLEYTVGEIEGATAISTTAQQSWSNVLATTSLSASQDSYIDTNSNTSNYGAAGSLIVDRSGGDEGNQRALIQFDLASISTGSTINSASLEMEASSTTGTFTIFVYELTQAWNESTVTWDTAPNFGPSTIATLSPAGIGQHSWDLTALVQDWVDGSKNNFGIMLGSPDMGTTTFTYDSREGTTVPQLVVDYTNSADAVDDSYATDADSVLTIVANGVLGNDSSSIATASATLEYIAAQDTDGNNIWEDSTGVAGFDFDFTGSDVVRDDTLSNAQAGISAAYVFGSGSPVTPNLGISPDLFGSLPDNPTNSAASFEFWIRPTDAIGTEIIFDVGNGVDGSGNEGASLRLNGSTLEWLVWDNGGTADAFATQDISAEIASGKFIQVVASFDPSGADTVSLTINGGAASTGFDANVNAWESPGESPAIGDNDGFTRVLNPTPGSELFRGEIAAFRFYESVLSSAEIQNNFDSLYFSVVAHDATSALGATVVVNADGSFSYDPSTLFVSLPAGATTVDTFSYTMEDSDGSQDSATVSITVTGVNDSPGATNLSSTSAYNEGDANVLITDIIVNDVDAGEIITATLTLADTSTGSLSANDGASYDGVTGIWTITGSVAQVNTALANLVFNPTLNNDVDTSIAVSIDDGDEDASGPLTGTITLDVTGVSASAPLTDSTLEDTDLVFSVANGNEITVGDGTIDDPILRTILTVTNGTLTLATTAGLTSVTGDGTDTVILIGSESDINTALDGLTYAPTNNYSGPADLTVTTDLQANLLGFYEFEINGDIGNDTSPNGTNVGAVVGATQIIDGTRGNVLHLDGNDFINIPGTFGDPQSLTLAAWVQLDAASGGSEVISLGDRVILRLDETFSGLGVFGSFYDGSAYLTTSSNTFIAGTGWHHIAYTLDGTANEQTLYIDGLAVDTTTHAPAVVYASGNSTLGRNASSASYFLEGEMDDARIYDRALSVSEIQALSIDQFSDTETVSITVNPVNNAPSVVPSTVFINELHYDNAGIDTGEAIEIMGVAGTDLSGWSLVLYNGLSSTLYDTVNLSGIIADQSNGYGTAVFSFPADGIQNDMDGIALINASSEVVQFISYEGAFTATDGPAAGLTSTDIGVEEDFTTPIGDSLQLTGTGSEFTWTAASASSFGSINTDQNVFAFDNGVEDTDNVYNHTQMLALLGASDIDDADANLTVNITNVVNGTLVMSGGAGEFGTTFTFTPDPEFSGQLSFDYQVFDDDAAGSAVGNGVIDIAAVNDAPVLGAIGAQSVDELSTLSFTASATDVDLPADNLTFSLDAASILLGMSINPTTGAFSWTPTEAQGGLTPSVTITVTDDGTGNLVDSEVITITVNEVNVAPVATNLNSTSPYIEGDVSVAITDIVISDADTSETITATLTLADTTTGSLSANDGATYDGVTGIWTLTDTVANINTAFANLVFNPTVNNDLDTSIDVNIDDGDEDGSGALSGTIDLNVTPVNDAPTATNTSQGWLYNEGVAALNLLDIVVSDVDSGETITATLALADPGTGSLTANDGASYNGGSGVWTITDTVANVNTALANLLFNPNTNNDINTSINVHIEDATGAGPADSTIDLDVTPFNDAPTATNLTQVLSYNEGDAVVALNDIVVTEVDTGDTITAALTLADTSTGTLSANDGASYNGGTGVWTITDTVTNVNTALANLVFNPDPANDVDTTITTHIEDALGTGPVDGSITLDVTPVNDAPTATNLSSTSAYNEGDASVPITDIVVSDVDTADIITATLTLADTATGSLTANDGATYDGLTGIWTITDTVANVNTALANLVFNPTVNNDVNTSIDVNIDDGDEDGSGALTGTIDLDVTPVNDAPMATNLSSTSAYNEGDASVAITDIVVADIDPGEIITATLTLANTATGGLSTNDGATYDGLTGIWTLTDTVANVNTALANLVFNPVANNDVNTTIAVNIDDGDEDGSGALTGTIDLDVTPVNDAPTATNLSSTSAYTEGDASVAITDIVVTDIDAAEVITATLTLADTATGGLSANDGATYDGLTGIWTLTDTVANINTALANLVFNPTVNNDVDTSIGVSIDDGDEDGSGALTGIIDLNVTPVNDAPTATNLSSGANYDQSDSVVALNDIVITDVDTGETVTATLTLANVSTGSLSANNGASYNATTGVWTITGSVAQVNTALANLEFTPVASNTLDTTVAISIDDGDEDSSGPLLGAMSITVNPLPVVDPPVDPPVIESEPDDPVEIPETEPPVETPDAEVVVELTKDNPLLVVGSGPVIADVSDDPAPSLLADSAVEFIDPDARIDNSEVPRETSVAKPVGVETLLIKLREQLEFFDDPMQLIGAESFITKLNDMREALVSETENTDKVIGSSLTVTAGFSVGYVVWLARSGVLLSSVLSSLPAWRFIDPLPVLSGLHSGKGDDDEESLESMVEDNGSDEESDEALRGDHGDV